MKKKKKFRKKCHKIITAHEWHIWLKNIFIQKEKKNKTAIGHECQIWYLVTRLYI